MVIFNNNTAKGAAYRRFQFFVRVLRHAGIPIFFKKIPKMFTLFDIACNICTWMTTVAMFIDVIMNTGGLETSMETLRIAAPCAMVTGLHGFVRWRVDAVARLMVLTEFFSLKEMETTDPDSVTSSMARWISRIKTVVRSVSIFALFLMPPYTFIRILAHTNNPLLFNAWYPYDVTVSPAFELSLFTQVVGCYVYVNMFAGFNGLYATIVTMVCMELEDIRDNIINIGKVRHRPMEMSSSAQNDQNREQSYNCEGEYVTQEDAFHLRPEKLKECVRRHQYVLSYIQIMERTLNPIMAEIMLLQLIAMCMISFSIVTSWGNGNEMLMAVSAYVLMTASVACYCWFGAQISDQAEQVRDAAYGCDWIGAPISLQRSVAMIITITNKEVALTAGKFAPLNTKTMMNMISQSLSYFMFLLEVKDKFIAPEYVENS